MTWKQWAIVVATFLLGAILGFLASLLCRDKGINQTSGEITTRVKYIYKTDTISIEKPKPYEVRIIDTMYVPVRDTIVKYDTTYTPLPREQKVYADSTYRAVISGFDPSLDSMTVYRSQTIMQTNFATSRKRLSVGVGPSLGVGWVSTFGGNSGLGLYGGLSFSLTYNF
jgi:hypothetical protein